ncbi:PAS domain S-box-containing protein/diguanylate cyclase (GGDEF) domain-containing protein [Modestobacter sp. DSM 44400]|nr:PAS domain S-box-containing protein/diguanylate cyclase (GGDEF) domain-containing protein [Modestobacter sp. DSM 44400]
MLAGAAAGAVPLAADLLLLVAALTTAALLWRGGRRAGAGLRGWTLLAVAVGLGLASTAAADLLLPAAHRQLLDPAAVLVPLPSLLLAIGGVLSLLSSGELRRGGARLLTETALFFSAALVLGQVLVVGPVLAAWPPGAPAGARLAIELSCLTTAALLSSVLVLVSAGARRVPGALLLLAAGSQAAAHGLSVVGADRSLAVLEAAVPDVQLASLLLICLAVLQDPGSHCDAPPTRSDVRLSQAGQLLPHLVMVAAALLFVGSAALGTQPTLVAALALLTGLGLTAVHRAVTARDESRVGARLRDSEAYFRSLVRSSSDAVLILDGELQVTWAAAVLEQAAVAAGSGLVGRPLPTVVHPADADAVTTWLAAEATTAGLTGLRTFRLPAADGSWRVLEAGVSDLRADADVRALVLHCRDITARLDREDELHSLAFTDPLTGLPNRAAQLAVLGRRLGALADGAGGRSVDGSEDGTDEDDVAASLLVFEVQGLLESRENVGGDVVDLALQEIARRLRATLRSEDQVARLGAESFSVLAVGTRADADKVAARCLSVIEQPLVTDFGLVDLTAAVGVVPLVAGLTEREALDHAELAVRDARAVAPGSVRRYHDGLGAARDRREQLRRDLIGARERGELTLAWQPIVALADHRVTGVEASLRWRHPVYGDVPPEEFLPVAGRAGLDVDLQRWVLREATLAAVGLPVHGVELKLGVDISARHLAAGTLVGDVSAALQASGLPPERLIVEIAESAVASGGEHDLADVSALRLMGVHVALDGFGSSHSTLPALARLPVDVLKLDRGFLARIDRDAYTRALVESVVGIGAALGVDVVAEGVETTSQLAVLEAIGCGFAQGFLLSRPVALPGVVQLLDQGAGQLWPGVPSRT